MFNRRAMRSRIGEGGGGLATRGCGTALLAPAVDLQDPVIAPPGVGPPCHSPLTTVCIPWTHMELSNASIYQQASSQRAAPRMRAAPTGIRGSLGAGRCRMHVQSWQVLSELRAGPLCRGGVQPQLVGWPEVGVGLQGQHLNGRGWGRGGVGWGRVRGGRVWSGVEQSKRGQG